MDVRKSWGRKKSNHSIGNNSIVNSTYITKIPRDCWILPFYRFPYTTKFPYFCYVEISVEDIYHNSNKSCQVIYSNVILHRPFNGLESQNINLSTSYLWGKLLNFANSLQSMRIENHNTCACRLRGTHK